MNSPGAAEIQFEREGARVQERGHNGALAAARTSAASRPDAGECLTLAQVAARLRCRPCDVPLRRPGEAEGIGYFTLPNGAVRVPVAELVDYIWRVTVKPEKKGMSDV
jgi:hypothetical protein